MYFRSKSVLPSVFFALFYTRNASGQYFQSRDWNTRLFISSARSARSGTALEPSAKSRILLSITTFGRAEIVSAPFLAPTRRAVEKLPNSLCLYFVYRGRCSVWRRFKHTLFQPLRMRRSIAATYWQMDCLGTACRNCRRKTPRTTRTPTPLYLFLSSAFFPSLLCAYIKRIRIFLYARVLYCIPSENVSKMNSPKTVVVLKKKKKYHVNYVYCL